MKTLQVPRRIGKGDAALRIGREIPPTAAQRPCYKNSARRLREPTAI